MKKRVLALLMAAALTLGICVPAFGATVENKTTHDYDAYQVFKGTQADNDAALGDIDWGSGVEGADLLAALNASSTLYKDCSTAQDVANVLSKYSDKSPEAQAFASVAAKYLTGSKTSIKSGMADVSLEKGYWLLVDTSDVGEKHDAKNPALLQVTGKEKLTIDKKYDVPSVDKAIVEGGSDHDAVDANIGDAVTFKLTATMPSTFEGYKTYKVVFHDTLSSGLTFDEDSVKVEIFEKDATTGKDVTESFEVGEELGELTFTCDNILLAEGVNASPESSIVVTYEATLNSGAEIGNPGNPNKVYLEYSNNPNWDASSAPAGEDEPTGKTPEEKVVVFTYELDVTKTDKGEVNKLQGAEFVLYRGEGSSIEYAQVTNGKLSDWTSNESEASKLASDSKGLFEVIGLDAGTYYLKETKAPAGYNLIENPIQLVIAATLGASDSGPALTKLTISVDNKTAKDGDVGTGVVSMTVENNKGPVLPETGGIGTTLFYVVGGALVIGAAVLLVVRRRAAGSEE